MRPASLTRWCSLFNIILQEFFIGWFFNTTYSTSKSPLISGDSWRLPSGAPLHYQQSRIWWLWMWQLTITMSNGVSEVNPLQCHLELFCNTKWIAPIADEFIHIPSYSLPKVGLNSLNCLGPRIFWKFCEKFHVFPHHSQKNHKLPNFHELVRKYGSMYFSGL